MRRAIAAPFGSSDRDAGGIFDGLLRLADARRASARQNSGDDADVGGAAPVKHAPCGALPGQLDWTPADIMRAVDFVRRRTPGAAWPAAPAAGAHAGAFEVSDPGPATPLEINYSLVERRAPGGRILPPPSSTPLSASQSLGGGAEGDENGASQSAPSWQAVVDPWAIDAAVRRRRPAWQFRLLVDRPAATDFLAALRDYNPNVDAVRPRAGAGLQDFWRATARRPPGGAPRCDHEVMEDPFFPQCDAFLILCLQLTQLSVHLYAPSP